MRRAKWWHAAMRPHLCCLGGSKMKAAMLHCRCKVFLTISYSSGLFCDGLLTLFCVLKLPWICDAENGISNDFALTPQMESYIVHIILFTRLRVQRDWVSARAVPRGGTEHHWRNLSCLSVFDPHLAQTCRHTPWRRGTRHTVQPHTRSPLWLVCPRWAGAHCPAWKLHQHVARCNSMLCIAWQCVILRVTLWNGCLVIVRL